MSILASKALLREKKIRLQNVTLVSIELVDLWFQVQYSPFWTNLAFACKTETLGSLYRHTLLILTKASKSKNQRVHKQSVGLGIRGPVVQWFNTNWGNILLLEFFVFHELIFFYVLKTQMPILALLPTSFNYEKPQMPSHIRLHEFLFYDAGLLRDQRVSSQRNRFGSSTGLSFLWVIFTDHKGMLSEEASFCSRGGG